MLKAQETERDMHNLHTFKRRLGWFYTWRQQARKGKNQKIRRKCATVAPYLASKPKEREKSKKYGANAPQLHHIWPQAAEDAHAPPPLPPLHQTCTRAQPL